MARSRRRPSAPGGGQGTRQVRIEDQRGRVHAIEVMIYGWHVLSPIDAVTKMPLTVKMVPMQVPESLSWPAPIPQARATLAGHACLHTVVRSGLLEGTDLR